MATTIQHVNADEFAAATTSGTVLVDFFATWCGPCRKQGEILEELARELPDTVKICKVDIDANPAPAVRYQVTSIPTLLVFKDGELRVTRIGLQSRAELLKMLGI